MHYHSPAAYRYLRDKFDKNLPCESTFCKWFSESNLKCSPGILSEAIQSLQGVVEKAKSEDKEIFGSLSFDEISIRKHIQWIHESKRWSGFITHGQLTDQSKLPVANNILVFMITIPEMCVSIPVAYYAINKLNADEKMILLQNVLPELTRIGLKITNITFDGLAANLSLCRKLGCSFDLENPKSYFINEFDDSKIFILLDPCHMLKLLRNSLGDLDCIDDPQLGQIKWSYFVSLERFRENSKFVTHRFTKKHRNRMNVRLAAQTFSIAVATSMTHLLQTGKSEFQGCESTINFISKTDKMFNIMNTERIENNCVFKSALNQNNALEVFQFLDEMLEYLKSLKFKTKLCIQSRRKTGFLGFFINITTIKQMYAEYILTQKLQSLPFFYLSQDPLETFFSRIRSNLLGRNDHPTIQQSNSSSPPLENFRSIMK